MKKSNKIRFIVMLGILALVMVLHALHSFLGSTYPSAHALCPLGGLENLWSWLIAGANVQKIFAGTMTLFFFTLVFALVFGRAFCGNICPFGFLQELMGKITKKKFEIPKKADNILRYLKYVILVLVTILAWITMKLWISPYDPYVAFAHIWQPGELLGENVIGFIILIIVLGASVFIDRFFCKYLCPAGALYGIIAKISPNKIERNECVSCKKCSNACPMNIDVASQTAINSAECIKCGKCVNSCPSDKNPLRFTFFKKAISPIIYFILVIGIFFGGIFVFQATGLLKVTPPSVAEIEETGETLGFEDLRGSMTLEEAAKLMGVEQAEVYKMFSIPESVPVETKFKDVAQFVPDFDLHKEIEKLMNH